MTMPGWDEVYAASAPPWDIGRPQPAFARLAEQGLLSGRVLDSGCGTGEQTLLRLADLGLTFDAIIDSGVFDDENRARYVASLASVLRPGGHCYLICFSDRQPGDYGPRRVSQDDLRAAFSHGWAVVSIEAAAFELNQPGPGPASAQAWLASIRRLTPG